MAKQKITQAERAKLAKISLQRIEKYRPERLSKETRNEVERLKNELFGKRSMTPQQQARYEFIKLQAQKEQEIAEQKQWKYRAKSSDIKLENKIAQKISGKDYGKNLAQYEKKFARQIDKRAHRLRYENYTIEQKQDMLLKYLGIGSRGVTLSDGTTFTQEEFLRILDRYDIALERFTENDEILKERYKKSKYNKWKKSLGYDIDALANAPDLSDREREGLRRMFKLYGTQ